MSQRHLLVIGSQCEALGRLSFLPRVAHDLFAVMTDPDLGGCVSAVHDGPLIDPTVGEAEDAIRAACRAAADAEATLFLAYVGHGTYVGRDFYLQPRDASPMPTARTGVKLVEVIKEEHQTYAGRGGLDGMVVLIDACGSGKAALAVTDAWAVQVQDRPLRFEVLTTTDHLPAYDGCFTRTLLILFLLGRHGLKAPPRSRHATLPPGR